MTRHLVALAAVAGFAAAPALAAPAAATPAPATPAPALAGTVAATPAKAARTPDMSERSSATFTAALNAFSAKGWHDVTHMRRVGGGIQAQALNAAGQRHTLTWQPGTDTVHAA
ncbi:MAG: hypothetical protein KGJ41_06775 [Rhodospirillales bacterium]|nr:hypothetical protein [Rhodospirillales bacterium]MDE2574026.1 hypothetical protein [Rhodospirillales bacterium]